MIYCDSPTTEVWSPAPQEVLPRPTWTKLLFGGRTLCNSLEAVRWSVQPVELLVCEGCWSAGCRMANLARMVCLGEHLILLPPAWDTIDPHIRSFIGPQNLLPEAVLMPRATWDGLRQRTPRLPAVEAFPLAVRQDLASLWLGAMPEAVWVADLSRLDDRLRSVLASDPVEREEAVEIVRNLAGWVAESPESPVEGRIVRCDEQTGPINTLYFDGTGIPEWLAFATGTEHAFAFGSEWVFREGP